LSERTRAQPHTFWPYNAPPDQEQIIKAKEAGKKKPMGYADMLFLSFYLGNGWGEIQTQWRPRKYLDRRIINGIDKVLVHWCLWNDPADYTWEAVEGLPIGGKLTLPRLQKAC
jgi:hypothetical protein